MPTTRYQYALPALAMMLGWGLRGFIGGGPFGAMIPGAMVILAISLFRRPPNVALAAGFAAVAVGFGGEMTYGQTVGYIVQPQTFWWGLLGLSLKGAIWGLLGGAVIGLAFLPVLSARLVATSSVVLVAATWVGWKFINDPKLIYFSNPYDRPRPEVWAGFLIAALALLAFLAKQSQLQPSLRFALWGALGGGVGFGSGGAIHSFCTIFLGHLKLHSWKYMEFTFGCCFGLALAHAASRLTPETERTQSPAPGLPAIGEAALAAILTAGLFYLERLIPGRFSYLVAGCLFFLIMHRYAWAAWHTALTITFTAAAYDSARYWVFDRKYGPQEPAYTIATIASILFGLAVIYKGKSAVPAFLLLTWGCVAISWVKYTMHPGGLSALIDLIPIAFFLMAAACTWMIRSNPAALSWEFLHPPAPQTHPRKSA